METPHFYPLVERTGVALAAWTAIRRRLRDELGELDAAAAMQRLEDICGEAKAAAVNGFDAKADQLAFAGVIKDGVRSLFKIADAPGMKKWRHVLKFATAYFYTCFSDTPQLGDVFRRSARPALTELGIDTGDETTTAQTH